MIRGSDLAVVVGECWCSDWAGLRSRKLVFVDSGLRRGEGDCLDAVYRAMILNEFPSDEVWDNIFRI